MRRRGGTLSRGAPLGGGSGPLFGFGGLGEDVWRGRRVMFEEKENFEKKVVDFRGRI